MNLDFEILWFDDTSDFFDSLPLAPFEDEVRSWGFEPKFETAFSAEEFMAKEPFTKYDLIVVDYNLEQDQAHGETFIKKVRDHQVYTEIIFYSANPASDLWAAISQAKIEGVYVANRQGVLDKLLNVARQSVHKVLDLNNMRGMVMAEVGDIDILIDSILRVGIGQLDPDEQSKIFGKFHKEAERQAQGNVDRLKAFIQGPDLEGMIGLCDSAKRWDNFNRLKKRNEAVKAAQVGDYHEDVLRPRNFLAHGKPVPTDEGLLFEHQGKKYLFDEKVSQSLRKTIRAYSRKFQEVENALLGQT